MLELWWGPISKPPAGAAAADPVAIQLRIQLQAKHCAAAMAHMHGSSRVGGDILDIDLLAAARLAIAVSLAGGKNVFYN